MFDDTRDLVLGVDPGLTVTGYGLVTGGSPPRARTAGVIRTDSSDTVERRLRVLFDELVVIIEDVRPTAVAIETVFTNRNLQTAISVGRASGVVMLAAARSGLEVSEYSPTAVKAAVTGDGGAAKPAVATMVARLLGLAQPPRPADAADALAVALCHLRSGRLQSLSRSAGARR